MILLIFLKLMFKLVLRQSEKFFRVLVIFFADFIPTQTKKDLDIIYKRIVATRLEPNSPNTIYCYDVRRKRER